MLQSIYEVHMSNFICISRLICLLVGLSACTGMNKEVIEKDIPILEDITEDCLRLDCGQEVDTMPPRKPLDPTLKRRRHRPGDHLILDKLMTVVENLSLA